MSGQFVRFLMVGGTATGVHYGILFVLHDRLGVNALVATSVGFVISAIFNFLASYHFTFKSQQLLHVAAYRFTVTALIGLALNSLLFSVLTQQLALHYMLAQILSTGVVLMWNFLAGKHFSFAGGHAQR